MRGWRKEKIREINRRRRLEKRKAEKIRGAPPLPVRESSCPAGWASHYGSP